MDKYKMYRTGSRQYGNIYDYMKQICEFMIEAGKNKLLYKYEIFISNYHKQTFLDICTYEYKSKYITKPIFIKPNYVPKDTIALIVDKSKITDVNTNELEQLSDEIKEILESGNKNKI